MKSKKSIRQEIFHKRKKYTDQEIEAMNRQIAEKVTGLPVFQNAEKIYIYIDFNHEAGTRAIIEEAWKQGKQIAIPKVEGEEIVFYRVQRDTRVEPGYMQIPEPVNGEKVGWTDALMIMPGVAFDAKRNRCGYGGGFYDRYLAEYDLYKIAIAFEFQMVESVPSELNDISPDLLVTEKRIYED